MRKIIICLGLFTALIGCKKDADLPALDFKFSVKTSEENFSDKGVNEVVKVDFDISADYDFEKVPLKYRIEAPKANEISDGSKKILVGDSYTLTEPKLSLHYTGKEKGEHRMKVVFFNQKGKEITKELVLNYKEYGYKLEVLNGNTNPHQGENVDFDLKITPENTSTKDFYLIFKSYDAQDPNLEKTLVALNGEKIVFDKEYKIENLSDIKLRINSFNAGQKQLKYVIKNSTFEREETIFQDVKRNSIIVESTSFNKVLAEDIGDLITFNAKIIKSPKHSNKFQYKTFIDNNGSEENVEIDGLSTNDWRDIISDGEGNISFGINTFKQGVYKYIIQVRDEFGNEVVAKEQILEVKTPEQFEAIFKTKSQKIMVTKPFNFNVTIKLNEKAKHFHSSVKYQMRFTYMKVNYNGKLYNEGEIIPIDKNGVKGIELVVEAEGVFSQNATQSFSGEVWNSNNITKIIKGQYPTFFQPLILKGALLRYSHWAHEYESWCIESCWHHKCTVNMGIPSYGLSTDSSMEKNDIKYVIYLEKSGGGLEHIGTLSYNELYFNTSDTVKKILDKYLGRSGGEKSPYTDNMKIEVLYKDKKVYEINGIKGFWYEHNKSIKYINFPSGTIYYDGYENPAK